MLFLALAVGVQIGLREFGRYRALAAPNDWMAPAIPQGALVLLEPVPVSSVHVGDVIAYRHPSRPTSPVLLRIVEEPPSPAFIVGRFFRLHGDTAAAPSEPWDAEFQGVVLRVAVVIPALGAGTQLGLVPPALLMPVASRPPA